MSRKQKAVSKKKLFQCPVCGLHYYNQRIAKDCEQYCRTHNACSLEIMRHSVESQPKGISSED